MYEVTEEDKHRREEIRKRVAEFENTIVDVVTTPQVSPEWLIEGVMFQGWLGCLAGAPNAGKSFISYTWAIAMATGMSAFSGIVPTADPRRVIYFDQENSEYDRNKYIAQIYNGLAVQNGVNPDLGLLHENLIVVPFWLGTDYWGEVVEEFILQYAPHAVFFDTATQCFNFANENDNAEAGQAINKLRKLQRMANPVATFVVLRHENPRKKDDKGQRRQMRGAKTWVASVDGTLHVIRTAGRPRKDSTFLSRIQPDKVRAWGLRDEIFITPQVIGDKDDARKALVLAGSKIASKDHKKKLAEEGEDE